MEPQNPKKIIRPLRPKPYTRLATDFLNPSVISTPPIPIPPRRITFPPPPPPPSSPSQPRLRILHPIRPLRPPQPTQSASSFSQPIRPLRPPQPTQFASSSTQPIHPPQPTQSVSQSIRPRHRVCFCEFCPIAYSPHTQQPARSPSPPPDIHMLDISPSSSDSTPSQPAHSSTQLYDWTTSTRSRWVDRSDIHNFLDSYDSFSD